MDDLVAIAKIAKPRGLKGELIADLLTDFPERFDDLENVIVLLPDGGRHELKIENAWFQNDRIVLKFEGVGSIDDAERLRNAEVCIAEAECVELGSDEFYDWQLEGCKVETVSGDELGTVSKVMRTGGTENLAVTGKAKEYLVPFAETICVEVDVENKRILVDPPEGLLEF